MDVLQVIIFYKMEKYTIKQITILDKLKYEIMPLDFTNHGEVDSFLEKLENYYNVVDYK